MTMTQPTKTSGNGHIIQQTPFLRSIRLALLAILALLSLNLNVFSAITLRSSPGYERRRRQQQPSLRERPRAKQVKQQKQNQNLRPKVSVIEDDAKKANATTNGSLEACRGVLVTSQGGVGTTAFLNTLKDLVVTNHHNDRDMFKHKPAIRWKTHNSSSIVGHVPENTYNYHGSVNPCFGKAMVIIGDPLHTLESTYKRFGVNHINKLRRGANLGTYEKNTTLQKIYMDMIQSGKDMTGVTEYIWGWYEASQDRSNWPEIKLVTARTLYDNAVEHARWLGVNESDLYKFSDFLFDASRIKTVNNATTGADVEMRISAMEVFGNATEIINRVEKCASIKI